VIFHRKFKEKALPFLETEKINNENKKKNFLEKTRKIFLWHPKRQNKNSFTVVDN